MVFCITLNSSHAVDHFLNENHISTVNYHGEVPAEERVENLEKFKRDDGKCPTLVYTNLAARGLDLDVDHDIMFDFPLNSIDYLHHTGRIARMGAKEGKTKLSKRTGTKSGYKTLKTPVKVSKKPSGTSSSKAKTGWKQQVNKKPNASRSVMKLNVVGFRARSSSSNKLGNLKLS